MTNYFTFAKKAKAFSFRIVVELEVISVEILFILNIIFI